MMPPAPPPVCLQITHWRSEGLCVLNVLVFPCSIKAGAGLGAAQLVVAQDDGMRMAPAQSLQQAEEACPLSLGAGVAGTAVGVEATLVAHAYGVPVVSRAVGTRHLFRAAGLYVAVAPHHVVITYAASSPGGDASCLSAWLMISWPGLTAEQ